MPFLRGMMGNGVAGSNMKEPGEARLLMFYVPMGISPAYAATTPAAPQDFSGLLHPFVFHMS